MIRFVYLLPFLLFGLNVFAHETPGTIPQGISRVRVIGTIIPDTNSKFDSEGMVIGSTSSLNRSVTIEDFVAKQPQLGTLVGALNALQTGLGDSLLNANLYSSFRVSANAVTAAYERGITERLTMGVRLPIVTKSVTHDFSVDAVNNALYAAQQLGGLSPELTAGLAGVDGVKLDAEFFKQSLFTSKGYEAPSSFSKTAPGDLDLGGKYQYSSNEHLKAAFTLGVRMPTGRSPSLTNPFDTGTGNGNWNVSTQFDQAYEFNEDFQIGTMAKLSFYVPDTKKRAVPKDALDSLPSLLPQDNQVHDVRRAQPVKLDTEVYTGYKLMNQSLELFTALQYSIKAKDSFSGPGLLFYDGLANGTDTALLSNSIGFEYSTIPLFRKKKFPIPMQVYAFFSQPIAGKNVSLSSYGRMDLKIYF